VGSLRRPRLSIRAVVIALALAACIAREVELSQIEQASTVPLNNFDFGDQAIHTTSLPHMFTISPTSGQVDNDTVDSITASCPDFTINAPNLPAPVTLPCLTAGSGTCTSFGSATTYSFTATFTPTVEGPSGNCPVTVTIDGVQSSFNLSGTGTAPAIEIEVTPQTPPAFSFGEVGIGTPSSPLTVTVQDIGSSASGLTVDSVTMAGSGFAIVSGTTTQHTVAPGTFDDYGVTCTPVAAGSASGTLTITSNDPVTPTSTVLFTCDGINSELAVQPSPAAIKGSQAGGATRVGEAVDIVFTLTNEGGAPLVLESIGVSGSPDLSIPSPPAANLALGSNGSATQVTVQYAPTQPVAEGTLGQLSIQVTGAAQPQTVAINGAAFATTMAFNGPLDLGAFGPVCVGTTSVQDFSILANQAGSFELTGVATPAAPFALTAASPPQLPTSGMPTPIAGNAGNPATFVVTATPTAAGSATSSFTFDTDIPAGSASQTIALTVLGLPPGVTASPASVDFGTADVDLVSSGQTVTVTNCGSGTLQLGTAALTGPEPDDFVIVEQPTSTTVASSASASYVVAMEAQHPGTRQATLQIPYAGGMVTVALIGTGLGGGDSGSGDKSYYSCAAGGTATSWPAFAALAFVVVRRRRRR
jgi:uncharacterized protein (TIGR03382 family)